MLTVERISKHFDAVHALSEVSAEFLPGRVHAVVGENGAGKSTLVKVIVGVYRPDGGRIFLDGSEVSFVSPREAIDHRISVVYQEPSLVSLLSVEQNLVLGNEPTRRGVINTRQVRHTAREVLREVGATIDPTAIVERLTLAERQLVEIAKALTVSARMIFLDEPTSSLSIQEIEQLRGVIGGLRDRGVGVVLITHDLDEVFLLADHVTVLKDGKVTLDTETAQVSQGDVVKAMIGRDLAHMFPQRRRSAKAAAEPIVQVKDLTVDGVVEGVSFELRPGQIVGFAGLIGAGRTDVARALVGSVPWSSGEITIGGERSRVKQPADAVALGIGLVPEDRLTDGLVMDLGVKQNIGLPQLRAMSRLGLIDRRNEGKVADRQIGSLAIKAASNGTVVHNLSGGNQQKVVLGRWLAKGCRVLILDEPTRGIDVGAKAEIYRIIKELANDGVAVMLISSELSEILHLADRIIVMSKGRVVADIDNESKTEADMADEEDLIRAALGLSK
jgi:ABC-type sugar transport system ATPase subunit